MDSHYVHLVCEKLFWEMFDDPDGCSKPTIEHYRAAVAQSLGIEQHLQKAYDHATMKNSDGYEEVLWAVADHSDLVRSSDSIYQSYPSCLSKRCVSATRKFSGSRMCRRSSSRYCRRARLWALRARPRSRRYR